MNFGTDNFRTTFALLDDRGSGGVLKVQGKNVSTHPASGGVVHRLLSTAAIDLIKVEGANYKAGATCMVLGGLIAGPIGAAAGAATGRLLRETRFALTFSTGPTYLCNAPNKLFENFNAHYKRTSGLLF